MLKSDTHNSVLPAFKPALSRLQKIISFVFD